MYAQIGEIVFEELVGFDSHKEKTEHEYSEHARIGLKPRLQSVGMKNGEISIGLRLHQHFMDVDKGIKELKQYQTDAEILPYYVGTGAFKGYYVIITIDISTDQTHEDGSTLMAQVSITLKETEPTGDTSRKNAKALGKKEGKALDSAKSNAAKLSKAAQKAKQAKEKVQKGVDKAKELKSKYDEISEDIKENLDKVKEAYQTCVHVIDTANDIYEQTKAAIITINHAIDMVETMKDNLPITSLAELQQDMWALEDAVTMVDDALSMSNVGAAVRDI